MSYQVINPFIQFVDPKNGNPLSAGSVYFGRQDSDPKNQPANRINVYAVQDNGSEVLLSQPITLNGAGQPQVSGSVKQIKIELYTGELTYAIQVFGKNGSQKGYSPRVSGVVDVQALGVVGSTVLVGGVEAGDLGRRYHDWVSVTDFGAAGDGVTDDTAAFNAGVTYCYGTGRRLYVPNPAVAYKITSTIQITQFVTIEGEAAGLQDNYYGKKPAGSLIKYSGAGACFEIVASDNLAADIRRAYGVSFKRLVIQGTNSASYGIKVGDISNLGSGPKNLSGINIEDVFIFDFFRGAAIGMFWVFGNNIKNFECQNCAVGLRTNYAHRTSIMGGTIEQCLMGVDAINTYDLTFHGTGLQGISATRAPIFGMVMPADLFVWDGWNGTGPNAILRTVPADYMGVGVRNLGSLISWFGGYEEANQVGYANEVGGTTRLYGKYTDLDSTVKYFVQLGSGSFVCSDNVFAQGQYPALVSVFAQEKDFAIAPFSVTNPIYALTVPDAKKNTGFNTAAGVVDSFDPATFRGFRRSYNYDYEVIRGNVSAAGFKQTGGFNRLVQEIVSPTSTGTVTVDLGTATAGTTLIHVTSAATVTFNFASGGSRLATGVEFIFHVINTGGSNSTLTFSTAQFRTGSASYTLGVNKQRIFRFVFSNGFFIEQGVEVAL
jgi:hypothetical protein